MVSSYKNQPESFCSRFGTIAVELGYLNRQQLLQALAEQVDDDLRRRPHRVLGAICFDHDWMTPSEIDEVLNAMFKARNPSNGPQLAAC